VKLHLKHYYILGNLEGKDYTDNTLEIYGHIERKGILGAVTLIKVIRCRTEKLYPLSALSFRKGATRTHTNQTILTSATQQIMFLLIIKIIIKPFNFLK